MTYLDRMSWRSGAPTFLCAVTHIPTLLNISGAWKRFEGRCQNPQLFQELQRDMNNGLCKTVRYTHQWTHAYNTMP